LLDYLAPLVDAARSVQSRASSERASTAAGGPEGEGLEEAVTEAREPLELRRRAPRRLLNFGVARATVARAGRTVARGGIPLVPLRRGGRREGAARTHESPTEGPTGE
jgi:hypothetical protein